MDRGFSSSKPPSSNRRGRSPHRGSRLGRTASSTSSMSESCSRCRGSSRSRGVGVADLVVPVFGVEGVHGVGDWAPVFADTHEGARHKTDSEAENLTGCCRSVIEYADGRGVTNMEAASTARRGRAAHTAWEAEYNGRRRAREHGTARVGDELVHEDQPRLLAGGGPEEEELGTDVRGGAHGRGHQLGAGGGGDRRQGTLRERSTRKLKMSSGPRGCSPAWRRDG